MARRRARRSRAQAGAEIGARQARIRQELETLGAVRATLLRAAQRASRGRAAIDPQFARFVRKRIPPDALPAEAWTMLVEGGTGLRKGDLLWAATALAAHLAANPHAGALTQAGQQWTTVADYLRLTKNKAHGPWPVVVQGAMNWHHRAAIVRRRREARERLRGAPPPRKPFVVFGDGNFGVILQKAQEIDDEGAACGHCLSRGRGGTHFSLRAPADDNLPFHTATFSLLGKEKRPGMKFEESKGNWNRLPPEQMSQARGAWLTLVRRHGLLREIGAVDDFLGLWFPRPLEEQRDHRLARSVDTLRKREVVLAVPEMLQMASVDLVGDVFHQGLDLPRLSPAGRTKAVRRLWPQLLAASEPVAAAFALALSTLDFETLEGRFDLPPIVQLAQDTRKLARVKDTTRYVTRKGVAPERRAQAIAVAASAEAATRLPLEAMTMWLLVAPEPEVRDWFTLYLRGEAGARRCGTDRGRETAQLLCWRVFVFRASRLPRAQLRALVAIEPALVSWLAQVRPDIGEAASAVSMKNTVEGKADLDVADPGFVQKLTQMTGSTYSRVVRVTMNRGLAYTHLALDFGHEGYGDHRFPDDLPPFDPDLEPDKREEVMRRGTTALGNLFWLLNSFPDKVEARTFVEGILEGVWLEANLWEQGEVSVPDPSTDRLSVALAELALAGRLGEVEGHPLIYLSESFEVLANAVDLIVSEKTTREAAVAATRDLVTWAEADDLFSSLFEFQDDPGGDYDHLHPLLWALDGGEVEGTGALHDYDTTLSPDVLQALKKYADEHALPYGWQTLAWVRG